MSPHNQHNSRMGLISKSPIFGSLVIEALLWEIKVMAVY